MIGGFMINYGVVGVGYFGAELARFMNMHDNAKLHVYTILKMEKILPVNCSVSICQAWML